MDINYPHLRNIIHKLPSGVEVISDEDVDIWLSDPKNLHDFWKQVRKTEYIYLITFTLKDPKLEEQAEQYIKSQAERRETLCITGLVYVKEKTKKGVSHWHVVMNTNKVLTKSRFAYYAKKFGFVDISRTKATTNQEALAYISKDNEPITLI